MCALKIPSKDPFPSLLRSEVQRRQLHTNARMGHALAAVTLGLLNKASSKILFIKVLHLGVQERGGKAGGQVGYSVRLDTRASASTQVLFSTTGEGMLPTMTCLLPETLLGH